MALVGCSGGDGSSGTTDNGDSGNAGDGSAAKDGAVVDSGSHDGASGDSSAHDTGTVDTGTVDTDSGSDATVADANADGSTAVDAGSDANADTGSTVVDAGSDAKVDSGSSADSGINDSGINDSGSTGVDSGSDSGAPKTYTVGGSISGLAGTGLVLQDNAGDDLSVTVDGTFTFAKALAAGASYAVTVKTQPTGLNQTCTVSNGSGTIGSANVAAVAVTCTTTTYTVGGTVSGLAVGATVVLQDNGGDDVALTANGGFVFATPVANGSNYAVTVKTQPSSPVQVCSVSNGSGAVGTSSVSVNVNCVTTAFTVGGTVSGLDAGQSVTLNDNGGDALVVNANGTFTFATPVASGANYAVTVATSPADRVCTVTNDSGTVAGGAVTNVSVSCSATICGEANENYTLDLTCPSGLVVRSIDFASYGTPAGTCGGYAADGNCDATTSVAIVDATCNGLTSCSVGANNGTFGDPCYGTYKHMYVQATCAP